MCKAIYFAGVALVIYWVLLQTQNDKRANDTPVSATEYQTEKASHIREIPPKSGATEVGYQAVVPQWKWVEVLNEEPVVQRFRNSNYELTTGRNCGIEFGGLVTVKEVLGDNLLVEYTAPGNPLGTPCPSGVRFNMSTTEFGTMSDHYVVIRDTIESEKELVKRLLAQNFYGEKKDAGNWHWIEVVNIDPVVQNYSNVNSYLSYGDTCGAGRSDHGDDSYTIEGGTIQVRGMEGSMVLYEYTAYGKPLGTPCPSGVLFFGGVK